jgi:diaminohydroxyphosphoribosylaminopyrimidine deaminase / 5-amino-6-(5-phosphoribosylamino)uracil reductase
VTVTAAELAAMRRAIALSAFGLGTTSPNPPVGCVILNTDGHLVGQGYHRRKGEPHAEANALADAGLRAHGGTAVVTLEPCNHHGRTPPCHQALIDAGVRRVLIALLDPTSRGEGGAARLRQAGIQVKTDVLADEARLVLGPWLHAHETKRPFVHWVTILDQPTCADPLTIVPDANTLLASHDAVLHANGTVLEAVPGAHGDNLDLPTQLDLDDPAVALGVLHRGGVRSVLLTADTDSVHRLFSSGLIGLSSIYLTQGTDRSTRGALPSELQVVQASKLAAWVRLTATPVLINDQAE